MVNVHEATAANLRTSNEHDSRKQGSSNRHGNGSCRSKMMIATKVSHRGMRRGAAKKSSNRLAEAQVNDRLGGVHSRMIRFSAPQKGQVESKTMVASWMSCVRVACMYL